MINCTLKICFLPEQKARYTMVEVRFSSVALAGNLTSVHLSDKHSLVLRILKLLPKAAANVKGEIAEGKLRPSVFSLGRVRRWHGLSRFVERYRQLGILHNDAALAVF